ncbi:3-dehydroquinate synthase [Tissierella sp. MSJ-40]|uniref:3-dehydroquinate synthase n=1 Tax=Tissierella simiarum TaxID=2841534 RepID=A0ABS6E6N9_9FIRM|nr:3-dehydroquinate synthase [Tissierella simiarum]MBU5438201.1 3-dehydroquinate synthase [Tissierella simiarum]
MEVQIVKNVWLELKEYIIERDIKKLFIITDKNIYNLYKENIDTFINKNNNLFIMEPGEEHKNIHTVHLVYKELLNKEIDRDGVILSIGGGVVGDLAGFVASTYKRGIRYIQVPTTLLSQVDSSIGGKVGIDFEGYKNVIGSFYFPMTTFVDTSFMKTLSQREITCGLGEILKYGLIIDYDFFKYMRSNITKMYEKDKEVILHAITKSISIKQSIVEKDKLDMGLRKILNFGHTVGHGIESYYKYKIFNHGEAVILGMVYESYIAKEKGLIDNSYFQEIFKTLNPLVQTRKFNEEEINRIIDYMKNDKKNKNGNISFVLPIGKGKVGMFNNIGEDIIKKILGDR